VTEVNVVIAFVAGVLGFLSPCIVPLIPGYVSFLSGLSLTEMDQAERRRHLGRALGATFLFVLGFALIFTALGASASLLGAFVMENRRLLSRVGGLVIIALGAAVLLRLPFLLRERRFRPARPPVGMLGAFPAGMAFAFAWTPCVGPVLTAVLTLAAAQPDAQRGAVLLLAYSAGLGLPFMAAAAVLALAFDLEWLRRYSRPVTAASGAFLVVMGVAMVTDALFRLNTWILRLVPFRPAL
jgi:cytochrome c-type biogenesis protein